MCKYMFSFFSNSQNSNGLHVDLGSHRLSVVESVQMQHPVQTVIVHPDYHDKQNDIALLRLQTPVTYSSGIGPVCLDKEYNPALYKSCVVTGWGQKQMPGGYTLSTRASTKWPPFRRRYFQLHFIESSCSYLYWTCTETYRTQRCGFSLWQQSKHLKLTEWCSVHNGLPYKGIVNPATVRRASSSCSGGGGGGGGGGGSSSSSRL